MYNNIGHLDAILLPLKRNAGFSDKGVFLGKQTQMSC